MKKLLLITLALLFAVSSVMANDKAKLIDELSAYLEFVDYGGGTIFAEGLTSVQAVLASKFVAMASGEWVVAGEYDKCKKQGIRRSQLQVSLKTRVV